MKKVRLNRDISILYRYGQRFFACRLAPLGVEVGQLPVLMQVYQMPGTTQDALITHEKYEDLEKMFS